MFGITSDSTIGVEINAHRLLLSEVRKKGSKYTLLKAAQVAVPSEVVSEGKILNAETLGGLLKDLLKRSKVKSKRVHLVVPSQFVVIRQLQMPDLPDKKMRKLIDFELQNSIHLPFEDPVYDYVKVAKKDEAAKDGGERTEAAAEDKAAERRGNDCDITLVASSRSAIQPLLEMAKKAGLTPAAVDIRALSLSRAFRCFRDRPESNTRMFVDVTETSTDLHIFDGENLKFTRNVPLSLENYKLDRAKDRPLNVLELLEYFHENTDFRSFSTDLAYEIERSLNFYRYTLNNRDAVLAQIVLSGILPKSGVLTMYLRERFQETAIEVMPFDRLMIGKQANIDPMLLHEFAIPIGLALKEVR
jgi:type IV pilus assembly protein PilM